MTERWITFDCFGTLVDWNGGFRQILEGPAGAAVDVLVANYHKFEASVEAEMPHRSYREVLAKSLELAAARSGLRSDAWEGTIISDSWEALRPFDDVESVLDELREMGFRLGVLTNCDDALFEVTQQHFRVPFDMVVTAELVMDYKPSLTHFRRFERMTGVGRGNWIHVACSWFHDIEPAARFGVPSVWLDRENTGEDPALARIRIEAASQLVAAVRGLGN